MSAGNGEGDGSEQTEQILHLQVNKVTYEKNATFYCETSLNGFVKEGRDIT